MVEGALAVAVLTLLAVILIPLFGRISRRNVEKKKVSAESAPFLGAKLIVRYEPIVLSNDIWDSPNYDKQAGGIIRFEDAKGHTGTCHLALQTFAATGIGIFQANMRFFGAQENEGKKPRVTYLKDENRGDLVSNHGQDGDHGYSCFYFNPRPVVANRSFGYVASVQTRGAWAGELHLRLDLTSNNTPWIIIPCQVIGDADHES